MYSLQMMEAGNFINGSIMFDLAAEGVSLQLLTENLPEVTASIENKKLFLTENLLCMELIKKSKAGLVKDLKYAVYE